MLLILIFTISDCLSSILSMQTTTTTYPPPPTAAFRIGPSGKIEMRVPEIPPDRNYKILDTTYNVYWCSNCKEDAGCSTTNLEGGYDHVCWNCMQVLPNVPETVSISVEHDYSGNIYMTEGSNYTTLDPVFSVFWCSKCKEDGGCSRSNLVSGYDHNCWNCDSSLPNAE